MIRVTMRWYRELCTGLLAEETPGNLRGDRLMKDVRPVISSNGVPFVQIKSVGSHSTSGREKEGKKEKIRKRNV